MSCGCGGGGAAVDDDAEEDEEDDEEEEVADELELAEPRSFIIGAKFCCGISCGGCC